MELEEPKELLGLQARKDQLESKEPLEHQELLVKLVESDQLEHKD